jgi:aromatic-L-amino-acid decarboxylase
MTPTNERHAAGTPAGSDLAAAAAPRRAPLAMDPAQFRALGHRLVDRIAERLAAIPDGPVCRGETAPEIRSALGLGGPLPQDGADPEALLEHATRVLFEHSLLNGHPRFFGYITSSPAPIGMLGDLLAAAVNANLGAFTLAPAASEIEVETVRWIAELIGYPGTAGGLLLSGGNLANMVCFWAARAARAGWDVRREGLRAQDGAALRVYGSAGTHTWIQKACDLAGLGTDAMVWVPTDQDERMEVAELRRCIEADRRAGLRPFMVVGTGGSVSTGAVDALPGIAALCREFDLWFHVDGAYGGFAAAVPEAPDDLRALALADSVAVDPHKWLYAPLEAGCALVRDPAHLRAAFSYHPAYYHLDTDGTNFVDYGPQNSRGFRALKVWLALRQVGASGYRTLISDDIRLSRRMAERVAAHPELEAATQQLSITTFRYVPADLRARTGDERVAAHLDAVNKEILVRTQRAGEVFVSNAVVGGRYLLRACIVNFHTDAGDIDAALEVIVRVGREVDRSLRAGDV